MGSSYTAHKLKTWNQFVLVVATPVPFFMWNCLIYFLINTRKYVFNKNTFPEKGNICEKYLKILPERESAGRWRRRRLWRLLVLCSARVSASRSTKQQRSVLLSWVSDGDRVRGERRARANCRHLFLAPFWLEDLFGGGSEHVSGGMWKKTFLQLVKSLFWLPLNSGDNWRDDGETLQVTHSGEKSNICWWRNTVGLLCKNVDLIEDPGWSQPFAAYAQLALQHLRNYPQCNSGSLIH